jgi:hypothetical protein
MTMPNARNLKWFAGLAAAALLVAAAYWGWSHRLEAQELKKAVGMSEDLFKPDTPQPVCFGRMVLDLPKGARRVGSLYQYQQLVGHSIEEKAGVTQEHFAASMAQFEQHLRTTKHEKDPSLLKSVREVPGHPNAKVFVHWEYEGAVALLNITGQAWVNGVQYTIGTEEEPDRVDATANDIVVALSNLRPRASNDIPTAHGFCLDTAFIPDDLKGDEFERAEISFAVAPWQGASISISTHTNQVKPTDRLLERQGLAAKRFPGFDSNVLETLRAQERTIGPYKGEELLMLFNENGNKFYFFIWEVQGEVKRNDPPDIHLELRVEQNRKPDEMTRQQALALWEYLLPRLTLRKVSATKTSAAEEPKVALGERATTGRICPQSGWWECADDLKLVQPLGLWLEEGQPMPKAQVWAEPSPWQRLLRQRPQAGLAAQWRLASYEDQTPPAATEAAIESPAAEDAGHDIADDPPKGDSHPR